jgi:transcriptional regulator with XRE-family HTH domain
MNDPFGDRRIKMPNGRLMWPEDVASLEFLGRLFKDARYVVGMTQRQLERATDIDQTTISRLENGRLTNMRLWKLGRIALVLRAGWRVPSAYAPAASPTHPAAPAAPAGVLMHPRSSGSEVEPEVSEVDLEGSEVVLES